jgi:hypothetical protein
MAKSGSKEVNRARAVVTRQRASLPAEPDKPWAEQTHSEQLNTLTGMSLDKTREILELPCDPNNLKLLSIQKDAALSVLSTQTKVDENRLREQRPDLLAKMLADIKEYEKDQELREIDHES